MEYVQMTLDDWVEMKRKLRQELLGVKQSFVRIGYALRQIEEQRYDEALREEGYEDILKYGVAFYRKECMVKSASAQIKK